MHSHGHRPTFCPLSPALFLVDLGASEAPGFQPSGSSLCLQSSPEQSKPPNPTRTLRPASSCVPVPSFLLSCHRSAPGLPPAPSPSPAGRGFICLSRSLLGEITETVTHRHQGESSSKLLGAERKQRKMMSS